MIVNADYKKTLQYTSPCHGNWGIVRIAAQVPESYQLFVCPFACGRHGALGAFQHGFKDRLSYVFVEQDDIIKGYDELIFQGVEALLLRIKIRPKAIFIYVSCLDDLIGTDHDALCAELATGIPALISVQDI